jgi:hypothetical protein
MKQSRFAGDQITGILKKADAKIPSANFLMEHGNGD